MLRLLSNSAAKLLVLLLGAMLSFTAVSGEKNWLKPYVLASTSSGDFNQTVSSTKAALTGAGFEVAGEYSPYKGVRIIVVTNDALKNTAAKSKFGGYGAAIRVAVTKTGGNIQVSYVNPSWMANIYRMKGDLKGVASSLASAIGNKQQFGTEGGWRSDQLRDYHYMIFMPYFDDHNELAKYSSYDKAISAVEAGLAAGKGGTTKVYRVDIPGKKESLYGVGLSAEGSNDKAIMDIVDIGKIKHSAHLPYDLLVSGNKVYALHGKFRIAQSFPDLTMTTFMRISDAPDNILDALKAAAGGR